MPWFLVHQSCQVYAGVVGRQGRLLVVISAREPQNGILEIPLPNTPAYAPGPSRDSAFPRMLLASRPLAPGLPGYFGNENRGANFTGIPQAVGSREQDAKHGDGGGLQRRHYYNRNIYSDISQQ